MKHSRFYIDGNSPANRPVVRSVEQIFGEQLDAAKKRIEQLEGLLRRMEWEGETPTDIQGQHAPSCPMCGGIHPGTPSSIYFDRDDRGHINDCELEAVLKVKR